MEERQERKPAVTIFYQFNPWQSSIGGIQTIIRSFIKYASPEFDIRLVGIGVCDPKMPAGQWHEAELAGRKILFFPLFDLPDDNVRRLVPTSVRYTLALLKRDLSSDFMHFYRLEPAFAALKWQGNKLLYVANDLYKKVKASSQDKSTLWQKFPQLYFALEKALIKQFDSILYCTSESLQFYKDQHPAVADRISHVRNTVDDEMFYPLSGSQQEASRKTLAKELNLPEETRFLLFAGRLHPQKDPLLLLQSLAALKGSTAHLLIAGEGELMPAIRQEIARLNLAGRVTLLGSVNQSRLLELYHIASAFVLTSLYEGMPIVALEALACGVPLITTRAGDTANLITPESGIVCEQRYPDAIAEAIDHLLEHPELYPQEGCTRAVDPYRGKTVVSEICADMLRQWENGQIDAQTDGAKRAAAVVG
ncbi:MAG: glycosyltransferase family 4 protein [Cyanobacteria bacterium J06581_3]